MGDLTNTSTAATPAGDAALSAGFVVATANNLYVNSIGLTIVSTGKVPSYSVAGSVEFTEFPSIYRISPVDR